MKTKQASVNRSHTFWRRGLAAAVAVSLMAGSAAALAGTKVIWGSPNPRGLNVGWSPFFLKGSFSFFVAFCVGYATRVWLKAAALVLGTFFLGVFLLSYAGALDVDWTTLESWWDALTARVRSEAADFKTFVTGSLPAAGLAGLGLLAGFKRR